MSDMPFSYITQSRLLSFSEKIKCFSKGISTYDQISEIFYEKEKYGIALLVAHIIENLNFPDKSEKAFLLNIENYNKENKTCLEFDNFKKIHWIRIIQDEIVLPEVIRHTIYEINSDTSKERIAALPENRRDIASCLADYVKSHDNPFLTEEKLSSICAALNLNMESITFLLKKDILKYNESNQLYYWYDHIHYSEQLGNEVSALLWMLIKNKLKDPQKAFQKYIYLTSKTNLVLRRIYGLLSDEDQKILYEQAVDYIQKDQDLLVCDDELEKIRLDSSYHTRTNINETAPSFNLKCNTIQELLEKIDLLEKQQMLNYISHETRKYLYSLLHLIMQYEQKNYIEKKYTIQFMIDLERPSIIFIFKLILQNNYPQMIPYLISCAELTPLAFQLLDSIQFKENIITASEGADSKNKNEYDLRNDLWLDFFKIVLNHFIDNCNSDDNNNQRKNQIIGNAISCIFLDTAQKIFDQYSHYHSTYIVLNAIQERYTSSFHIFQRAQTRFNIYNKGLYVKSNIAYFLIPHIVNNIEHRLRNSKIQYGYFDFNIVPLDVMVDMLGIVIHPFDTIEFEATQKQAINNLLPESIKCIYDYFCYFLYAQTIEYIDYDLETKVKNVEIVSDISRLDRTNWAFLIMLLNKYDFLKNLMEYFDSVIIFDKSKKQYDYQNKNQYYRIRVLLRILLYSYLHLKEEKNWYNFSIDLQEKTTVYLEALITKYMLRYSKNDIMNNRIDAVDDNLVLDGFRQGNSILYLLFLALNHFPGALQKDFVSRFFVESTDLRRMLVAVNTIKSDEVQNIITDCINKINIEEFINSCFTVTEWEETLIEAINSEAYWHFAKPLVERIKEHYINRKYNNEQIDFLLYQVELSVAMRNKDLKNLAEIEYKSPSTIVYRKNSPDDIKTYFIARHWLENEKKYDKAINLLKSLLSKDAKNIRYFLLLYKARFYKSLGTEGTCAIDHDEIFTAWHEWQNFKKMFDEEGNNAAELNNDLITLYSLPYYILTKDSSHFDSVILSIPDELLFTLSNLVKLIYDFYAERNLEPLAFRFLNKANGFFKKSGIIVPALISELLVNPDNDVLAKLKESFRDIVTSNYRHIPLITPPSINEKNELGLFILNELIKAIKQLQDRIKAIGTEDNHTDLIQSILTMRFPFYGWYISEQAHRGQSESGKQAGETDLIIKANDEDIALIEALILRGGDFTETSSHILKSFNYSNRLDRYYILVYYKGKENNFLPAWESYKKNVMEIDFSDGKKLKNPKAPFIDLDKKFENTRTFKTAKTCHDGDFEMFHIMADFHCE